MIRRSRTIFPFVHFYLSFTPAMPLHAEIRDFGINFVLINNVQGDLKLIWIIMIIIWWKSLSFLSHFFSSLHLRKPSSIVREIVVPTIWPTTSCRRWEQRDLQRRRRRTDNFLTSCCYDCGFSPIVSFAFISLLTNKITVLDFLEIIVEWVGYAMNFSLNWINLRVEAGKILDGTPEK